MCFACLNALGLCGTCKYLAIIGKEVASETCSIATCKCSRSQQVLTTYCIQCIGYEVHPLEGEPA